MLLEVCNDNLLFFFSQTKYLNILCYFVIFLCILLCLIIKNKSLFKINKNLIGVKIAIFIASLAFLIFLLLIFITIINSPKFEGCYCEVESRVQINDKVKYPSNNLLDITNNKVIIVGDSRMEFIEDAADDLEIPINFSFIAKGGATIDWFEDTALSRLIEKLNKRDSNYHYHVVINMGVNDLDSVNNVAQRANEYFEYYKELAFEYPDVQFYMLSVNPIFNKINKSFPGNKRTDGKIQTFNNQISHLLARINLKNMYICDSYHHVDFNSPDGLHYDLATDQRILDYIANDCIKYE